MSDLPPSPAQGDAIASQSVVLSRDYTSIRSIYRLARPSLAAFFVAHAHISARFVVFICGSRVNKESSIIASPFGKIPRAIFNLLAYTDGQ